GRRTSLRTMLVPAQCPLLAFSGRLDRDRKCPLSGGKADTPSAPIIEIVGNNRLGGKIILSSKVADPAWCLPSSRGRPLNAPAAFIHPCQPIVAKQAFRALSIAGQIKMSDLESVEQNL